MSWITIAVISHLITGVANITDKFVVSKYLKAASVYAFYVGILEIIALVLIPFGVSWPGSAFQMILTLLFGATFIASFYLMNAALLRGETSRVITIIGGSLPIFSFTFSYFFLGERLSELQVLAFTILVLGIILIGIDLRTLGKHLPSKGYLPRALAAGLFFGITFVGSKYVFNTQSFVSGFFWMRMGAVLAGLAILLIPTWRREIIADFKTPKKEQARGKAFALGNQVVGAVGFVLLNYAISLGSATIVNALQGVQYAFIFILAVIFGRWIPQIKEEVSAWIVVQKILAIVLISIGLYLLT